MVDGIEINPNQTLEQIQAMTIVKDERTRFDEIVFRNRSILDKTRERVDELEQKKKGEKDIYQAERYTRQIVDVNRTLRIHEARVKFARLPFEKDVEYRLKIIKWFPKKIKEIVPDNLPLVFHGVNNIGQVRQIIKTEGLLIPDQRGESYTSFATQIDVGAKTNVRVPCEFAESNHYWMPYGAIFAFLPKPEEYNEVNKTGDGTEVFGGVDGVNFKEEPNRLFGIITSPENIEQIQGWCKEYGLDSSKVMTHDGFVESIAK
jgi:hypothetical protein